MIKTNNYLETNNDKTISIIGAGMAGCYLAIGLAQKGFQVAVYDSRPDPRIEHPTEGKSFNLTIYKRALESLKKIGIWNEIKPITAAISGNTTHLLDKVINTQFKDLDSIAYSIHRTRLHQRLVEIAASYSQLSLFFNHQFIRLNRAARTLTLITPNNRLIEKPAYLVVGADGLNSLVRSEFQQAQQTCHIQNYLDWGYKELHLPVCLVKELKLNKHYTQAWPRDFSLFLAFPNPDESFTLMLNLPLKGLISWESMRDEGSVTAYISSMCSDLIPALPHLTHAFLNHPIGTFSYINTKPWYYKNWGVLIGDAAHATVPFLGQGMAAGFDDGDKLIDILTKKQELQTGFEQYQHERKTETDILIQLSKDNFRQLKDTTRCIRSLLDQQFDSFVHRLFPHSWAPPVYQLVSNTTIPFTQIDAIIRKQTKIKRVLGIPVLLAIIASIIRLGYKFQGLLRSLSVYTTPQIRKVTV